MYPYAKLFFFNFVVPKDNLGGTMQDISTHFQALVISITIKKFTFFAILTTFVKILTSNRYSTKINVDLLSVSILYLIYFSIRAIYKKPCITFLNFLKEHKHFNQQLSKKTKKICFPFS